MSRVQQLLSKLADPDYGDDWSEACDALTKEASAEWLPDLRTAFLAAPDFVMREALSTPIAHFGGVTDLPMLLEGARLGEEEGHDNDSLNAAICDVVEAFPVESFALLEQLAKSDDPWLRKDAAWLLGFIDTKESFCILVHLIKDQAIEVARPAIFSIASLTSGDGRKAIKSLPFLFRLANRRDINLALKTALENVRS